MHTLPEEDIVHIWKQAERCRHELADSRIFITGGTGFFGRWLLESLAYAVEHLGLKTEVLVLSRDPVRFLEELPVLKQAKWLHWLTGDVRDFTFPEGRYTHLIHAATDASADLNRDDPLSMLDTITVGTRRVLEFARLAHVKRFLFVSSGAVYGKQTDHCTHVSESHIGYADPLQAASAYAIGKLHAEHLCCLYARQYSFSVMIARCFAFVGPYLPLFKHFAIGNFIANAVAREPINVKGDGSPYRSYLYAADLAVWLWTILCFGESSTAYNVGSEAGISIADLAQLISEQTRPSMPVSLTRQRDPGTMVERYVPCTRRARESLQLDVWVSLPDAIKRTIIWNQNNAKSK